MCPEPPVKEGAKHRSEGGDKTWKTAADFCARKQEPKLTPSDLTCMNKRSQNLLLRLTVPFCAILHSHSLALVLPQLLLSHRVRVSAGGG